MGASDSQASAAQRDSEWLREAVRAVVFDTDLETTSFRDFMGFLSTHLALPLDALSDRREEIQGFAEAFVRERVGQVDEDLGVEIVTSSKQSYLVTLSHPRVQASACGVPLKAPGDFSREQIKDAILASVEAWGMGKGRFWAPTITEISRPPSHQVP